MRPPKGPARQEDARRPRFIGPTLCSRSARYSQPHTIVSAQDLVLGASVQMTGPVANTGRYYRDA